MNKTPETIAQEFAQAIKDNLKRTNLGKIASNKVSPRGAFNEGLESSLPLLCDILGVCSICQGKGTIEVQTAVDDSITRSCECQGEPDDFSGASEGDR